MPDKIAPNSQGSASSTGLALRFISGKYQGGELPLEEGQEILIGRSSNLTMVLVEEMVSRKHARILYDGRAISIEDLGSTNGTFVNGEKIRKTTLQEGDRVLIGTSILKVVSTASPRSRIGAQMASARRGSPRQPGVTEIPGEAPRMTGKLEEIPLPDLLQLFGTSRKTGVLIIRRDGTGGRIHLAEGKIISVVMDKLPGVDPLKAAYRMLAWDAGFFELAPAEEVPKDNTINVSVQEVLMEGFRQKDELEELRRKLPPAKAKLVLKSPSPAPLHSLEAAHLDVLQLALNVPNIEVLFDRSPVTDLATAEIIVSLMKRGFLGTE